MEEWLKSQPQPGDLESFSPRSKWVKNQDSKLDIPLHVPGDLEETQFWPLEVTPRVTFACRLGQPMKKNAVGAWKPFP